MKRTSIFLVVVLPLTIVLASLSQAQLKNSGKVNASMIVTTDWLAKHLNDDSLVLLQVGERKDYDAEHIPGARFIQLSDISTPRGQGLILELPSVDQLKATFEKLGVTDKSRVIVYFGKDWVTPTARVFMTLDYLGLGDRTSILDGGLPAWRAEGKPLTAELREPKPGHFTPAPNARLVVDAMWVKANLNKPGVAILDARAAKFYTGAEAGQMPRAGHIPSAKNIPFSSLVDESTNKFKSVESLRYLFNAAGVKPADSIATYCHIGQQASLLYFVARYLGYEAHLYDGSFQDWSNRSELPVEKSDGEKPAAKP
ncbi:MAG TPA: sulfurtransferase [Pyrinomonadaceae bacterium]|nr:sulfurtransferase [Pyrinomonadaceae bacterium]